MNVFSISKRLLLLGLSCITLLMAEAQDAGIKVTGSVINEKGEPVDLASVRVTGTDHGTVTDSLGAFILTAPANAWLTISHIGYDTLQVKAQAQMTITIRSSAGQLDDVVVIGYGTQRKKEVTGAIATVTAKDFQQGNISTPEQLIAGKVAGVSITSNGGAPGAGSTIRIRGGASLNASNNPLIVVDGVPLSGNNIYGASNSLSLINPNDIASFTVLKDASATAIYGSRASNGVIIITTKKGTSGSPSFNFTTQVSASTLAKKMNVQSASDFRHYVDSLGSSAFTGLLGSANTDWQDEIFQTAISTDDNLSMSGALKNMPYRVSVGYLGQQGILRTDKLDRYSAGISATPRLLDDHLKIDINLKGAYSHARFANNAAISSAAYFDPTQPVYSNSRYGGYFEWEAVDAATGDITLNKLAPRNPVALLDLYDNESDVYRSYGNVQFDYKFHFLPDLHANLNLGYDYAKGKGTIDVPAYAAQNYLDSGQANKYSNKINNKVLEFYFNYIKDLAAIHSNLNLTMGYGYYNNLSLNDNYPSFRANGDTIPATTPLFPQDRQENTLISYYGRLIYTFHDKYTLAASVRTDGSSRFAPDTRWGTFPSVAFTWQLNRENFLQQATSLSDLKLRLSYGITGNQDGISNYPYQAVYGLSGSSSLVQLGDTYYYMGTPSAYDANLKWEQTATWNAGIDYGFLKQRINGSVDVYYKKTKDLLNVIPIPAGSNFSSTILTNVGNVNNRGVEFAINAAVLQTKQYSWDVSFNAAYNKIEITNLTATDDSTYAGTMTGDGVIQIHTVGYQPNSYYVYHQQYLDGKPVEGVYEDVDGNGKIDEHDLYHYKSPFPKYVLGFSTQFTYGKWSVSTVLRANIGNYMYNGLAVGSVQSNVFNPLGYLTNSLYDLYHTGFVNSQKQSDYYIENASFLRMDNLGLGYNLGSILHHKANMRITANCQNVFTVTKYSGLDPEVFGGIDNTIYPRPRTFVLGANLQF